MGPQPGFSGEPKVRFYANFQNLTVCLCIFINRERYLSVCKSSRSLKSEYFKLKKFEEVI